jgi:hypothetical protein
MVWQQKGPDEKLLVGEWLRRGSDNLTLTNLTLRITGVYTSDKLDVYYLVPRSIDVFKASWTKTGQLLQVYVEFQDDFFRGSFYKLIYDPEKDLLKGEYYDAQEGITYPVEFIRTK